MFTLKKIITAFLLPPGCIILLLAWIACWRMKKREIAGGLLAGGACALLWLASVGPVGERIMGGLESPYPLPSRPSGDVILLLGGGIYEGVDDWSGKGAPTPDMLTRIVTAVRLQKATGLPVIISGGAVFPGQTPEAAVDKRFLVDLGVPADKILLEEKSRDTMENAEYSAKICAARGFRHPLLVTSAYHLRRAVVACNRHGLKVTPVPAFFQTGRQHAHGWQSIVPSAGALLQTSTGLHEYVGLLFYRLADRH